MVDVIRGHIIEANNFGIVGFDSYYFKKVGTMVANPSKKKKFGNVKVGSEMDSISLKFIVLFFFLIKKKCLQLSLSKILFIFISGFYSDLFIIFQVKFTTCFSLSLLFFFLFFFFFIIIIIGCSLTLFGHHLSQYNTPKNFVYVCF